MQKKYKIKHQIPKSAFSLVEMLMALLVASLLLAALAPVMTRRMADSEIKVMNEAANYDKDMVVSLFTKNTDFNIPSDANQVRVTLMGGGGKGGDALYGNRTFTSNGTFIVPDNVTKLRVFMIGGGGGGASGGLIPQTVNIESEGPYKDFLTPGETSFTIKDSDKTVPQMNQHCKTAGVTNWTSILTDEMKADGSILAEYAPNETIQTRVTACGGGGGGGTPQGSDSNYTSAWGGKGGYVSDVIITPSTSTLFIKVGGGGGQAVYRKGGTPAEYGGGGAGGSMGLTDSTAFGSAGEYGGQGGISYGGTRGAEAGFDGTTSEDTFYAAGGSRSYGSNYSGAGGRGGLWGGGGGGGGATTTGCTGQGGGGGGGPTTVTTASGTVSSSILVQAGGGGGVGGYGTCSTASGGGGGGGGGVGGGSGGPGSSSISFAVAKESAGGDGEGGKNGISTVFRSNEHCNGGYRSIGSPGALRLYYTYPPLKCEYIATANSGGGGGAGQIWIGELMVTPGQKLNFNIGIGGSRTTSYGANGNNGGSTSITTSSGSTLISVSGGKGGKYESDDTYINNSYGIGGGIKTSNTDSSFARYVNWKETNFHTGGENGGMAKTPSQGAGGGKGGQLYDLDGNLLKGGNESSAQSDGFDAPNTSYGAGGSGGGGVIIDGGTPGHGGKGANGYIYIEWGGTNGSGGTMGEFIQTTVTNLNPDPAKRVMKIRIGKGGGMDNNNDNEEEDSEDSELFDSSTIGINGNGGETSISIISGNKTITHKARGGLRGNDGSMDNNIHGEEMKYPSNYSELYKEYIQSNLTAIIASGQKGTNDYGGMGGYISCLFKTKDEEGNSICSQTIKSNDGTNITIGPIRPGCGGTSILSPLYDSICNISNQTPSPDGNNGLYGAGGGGGAVLNNTGGKGGYGGNGFVILEYKSTTLD